MSNDKEMKEMKEMKGDEGEEKSSQSKETDDKTWRKKRLSSQAVYKVKTLSAVTRHRGDKSRKTR